MKILWFAAVFVHCASAASAQNPDPVVIDREVRQALRQWDVPGTAIVIVRRDGVVLQKGFGVRQLGADEPVGPDTVFPIASCTKSFTSAALAILVDDGRIGWDDPVRKHLPDFHLSDPNADALVTVRDLLCHRTGVASHDYLWYRAPWTQDEMIRRIGLVPLAGTFRSSFAYQSIMFIAAGKIVGACEGSWDGFLRRRLLQPLGMTATCTTSTEAAKKNNVAQGHRRSKNGAIERMDFYPQPDPNPAGSIHTSARDLSRWLQFQLGDGSWRGKRIVSAANLGETHRPQSIIPGGDLTRALTPDSVQLTYGMGWVISDYRGVKVLSHAGLIDGFRCQLTLLPDHRLAFGLMNNLHATKMNLALTNRLIDLFLDLPEKDWHSHYNDVQDGEDRMAKDAERRRDEIRKKGKKPTFGLTLYAGRYEHLAYGTAEVRATEKGLVWEWSSFRRDLLPYSGNTFGVRNVMVDEQEVTFGIREGKIVEMKALGVVFTRK